MSHTLEKNESENKSGRKEEVEDFLNNESSISEVPIIKILFNLKIPLKRKGPDEGRLPVDALTTLTQKRNFQSLQQTAIQ